MDIIELFIDENDEVSGIEAISVVEQPAIEEDFIALKNQEFKLAEVDKEKRILMGAALIPNKPIYRKSGDQEYYIYFSRDTVRKASELFFIRGNQSNSTFEHKLPLEGLTAVESWIVESEKEEKQALSVQEPVKKITHNPESKNQIDLNIKRKRTDSTLSRAMARIANINN